MPTTKITATVTRTQTITATVEVENPECFTVMGRPAGEAFHAFMDALDGSDFDGEVTFSNITVGEA